MRKKEFNKWNDFVGSVDEQYYPDSGRYKREINKLYIIMGEKYGISLDGCSLCFCDINRHIAKTKREILKRLDCQFGRKARIVEFDMRTLDCKLLFSGIIGK